MRAPVYLILCICITMHDLLPKCAGARASAIIDEVEEQNRRKYTLNLCIVNRYSRVLGMVITAIILIGLLLLLSLSSVCVHIWLMF